MDGVNSRKGELILSHQTVRRFKSVLIRVIRGLKKIIHSLSFYLIYIISPLKQCHGFDLIKWSNCAVLNLANQVKLNIYLREAP